MTTVEPIFACKGDVCAGEELGSGGGTVCPRKDAQSHVSAVTGTIIGIIGGKQRCLQTEICGQRDPLAASPRLDVEIAAFSVF